MKNSAITDSHGTKRWFKEGTRILHREDGPAVEYFNGDKVWYCNGKMHRLDGPTFISRDGSKFWYAYGELHREDGPAIECFTYREWYYRGIKTKCKSQEEFELWLRLEKLKAFG